MASILPYGACQTACNAAALVCYGAASTVMGVGSVPACNSAQGVCMHSCAVSFLGGAVVEASGYVMMGPVGVAIGSLCMLSAYVFK